MKCLICDYESDDTKDFNDSNPGRPLCKMRGHWACVRNFYTICFMKNYKHSAGDIEDKVKRIKAKAKREREANEAQKHINHKPICSNNNHGFCNIYTG